MDKRTVLEMPVPQFARTRLPGGVRVVTEHVPAVRSVSVGVWVEAGSRDERIAEAGITHFVEHMVFKGTRRRSMRQIARRMESVGGYLNAFTGKEYTCYYARALDVHLERAVDAVADLVLEPTFPAGEIEKEKDVVLEEMRMYQDVPEDRIFDHFEEVVYHGHALARPVIGSEKTVRSLSGERLHEYVGRMYTPDRIVVSVAGHVDHQQAVTFVARAFERCERAKRRRRRRPMPQYQPALFEDVAPTQQAHLVLGTRGVSVRDEERLPLVILNTLLGGGMSSRLHQNLRERHGICYSVYSFMNHHSDGGDFGVYVATEPARVDRAQRLALQEVLRAAEQRVSSRELNQVKNQVKGSILLGLESMSNRMMRLGRQELYFRRHATLDEIVEQVDAVTADQIRAAAGRLLARDQFSTVLLKPAA